ncbi:MAG: oligosaccharide flippase family protein [Candidatus Thorarchaeota archaeon]
MIGRKSFLIMLSRLFSAGLTFIGLFFITRYLGAEIYGTIAWTMALVATFNCVSDLGLNAAHIKRVSEGKNINDCLSTFVVGKLLLTALMVVFVISSLTIWTMVLGNPLTETSTNIVLLFVLFYVFYDIATIATVTFDARLETAKSQLALLINPLVRVPLVVFISLNGLQDIHLAYAYVLAGTGFAIASMLLLSREKISWKRPTLFRSYMIFAIPIATVIIMGAISGNIDKLLIGIFWNVESVGYYSASQQILILFSVVGVAVSTLAFPAFSKLHSEGDIRAVRAGTLEAERYISMIALPAITVIVLFPTEVARVLLGGGFAESGGPMRFLAISIFFSLLNGVYLSQIYAVNRPDLTAKLFFISLIVNIFFLMILVPSSFAGLELFGLAATGAAIANMLYFATMFISFRFVTGRLTGTGFNSRLLLHLVAAALSGIVILVLSSFWILDGWIALFSYGLISFAVFSFALFILRELKRSDLEYLLRVINPKEMMNYIFSELKGKKQ